MTRGQHVAIVVVATIWCAGAGNARAQGRPYHQWPSKAEQLRIVEKAKNVTAQALDASQPAVLLDRWLKDTLGSKATIDWAVGDCDLKPSYDQTDGYPMCAEVRAGRPHHIGLRLLVLMGTVTGGVSGAPTVTEQSFIACWSSKGLAAGMHFPVKTLSDIPKHIETLTSRPECR
jgi:hypothetical protein